MPKSIYLRLLLLYIVVNTAYFLFASFISVFCSLELTFNFAGYLDIHHRNDTAWYEIIFSKGYRTITDPIQFGYHNSETDYKQSEWPFFPLFPLILKGISICTGLSFNASAFIYSIVITPLCFYSFFQLAYYYAENKEKAFYITLAFVLFPFHYHYSMFYTEPLFLFLLLQSFNSLIKHKYLQFALYTSLIVLVRPNGLVALGPLFLFFLEQEGLLSKTKIFFSRINFKLLGKALIFLAGFLSFAIYLFYQYEKTGHYFAFVKGQAGWDRTPNFPLFTLYLEVPRIAAYVNSTYTILIMIIGYWVWKRFDWSYNLLLWLTILMPLTSGATDSLPRYISIVFPVFYLIGEYMYEFKCRYLLLGISFVLQLVLFKFWLFNARISY